MRDPYLFPDEDVLRNKLDIHDQKLLGEAEADYVSYRLKDIVINPIPGNYHTNHLLKMHWYIFQDLYDWAGEPRVISIYKEEPILGGQSIEYSDPFDIVPDIHHVLSDVREKSWSAMDRDTLSDEFSDFLARLWKIHPFREGNTRTTVTFCCQFIDEAGREINRALFESNARYVRTALVAYNAFFADGNDFSKKNIFVELYMIPLLENEKLIME